MAATLEAVNLQTQGPRRETLCEGCVKTLSTQIWSYWQKVVGASQHTDMNPYGIPNYHTAHWLLRFLPADLVTRDTQHINTSKHEAHLNI
jgi:hypothetical protein